MSAKYNVLNWSVPISASVTPENVLDGYAPSDADTWGGYTTKAEAIQEASDLARKSPGKIFVVIAVEGYAYSPEGHIYKEIK